MYNKRSRRQEGWEWEGQNSGEQRHEEICGRERDGVGVHGVNKMDATETFRKEIREFERGGFGVD